MLGLLSCTREAPALARPRIEALGLTFALPAPTTRSERHGEVTLVARDGSRYPVVIRARTGSADAVVLDERLVSECGLVVTYRVSVVDGGMGGPEADVRGSVEGAQVDLYCHAQAEHAPEAACLAAFTTICQTAP